MASHPDYPSESQSLIGVRNENGTNSSGKKCERWTIAAGVLIIVVAFSSYLLGLPKRSSSTTKEPLSDMSTEPLWPKFLSSQVLLYNERPANTSQAVALDWVKSDEPCEPTLGEPWLYKGRRGFNTSVTLYFTPEDGDVAGSLSGIEVDIYGYLEKNLVGTYFSEAKTSEDGTYHSLAVALRNSAKEDLCSKSAKRNVHDKYLAIAPGLKNEEIPAHNSSPLLGTWKEGSCIPGMGNHWFKDTVGGKNLSFKAENTVPIVPMYDNDGTIMAIFFLATSKKQNWAPGCDCLAEIRAPTPECLGTSNFWDPCEGLNQANKGMLYICNNLCGECDFTGSGATPGMYTTMHWFFNEQPQNFECVGSNRGPMSYCPSGLYPTLLP